MTGSNHRELPFWEDLYKVTKSVPPWGLFSLMAERPEVPLKLPVPTTFILEPNEKLVARICTSLEGKLQIRRDSRETPVTFEMLETNMIAAYNARTSDHQPYICVLYAADDWTPHFVSKDNFSLLTLHLRASVGQNVSSYGREEHATATLLFPERIMCVQAYVPLQEDRRYLSVFLYSPVKTLHEVHCRAYYQQARVSTFLYEARELTEGELNNPLSRTDPLAQQMAKYTAGIISCLRRHRAISLPGFVCEYVHCVDGQLYMTSVHRVSTPHVRYFPANVPAAQQEKTSRSRYVSCVSTTTTTAATGGSGASSSTLAVAPMAPTSSPHHSTTTTPRHDQLPVMPAATPPGISSSTAGTSSAGIGSTIVSAMRKKPGARKDLTVIVEEYVPPPHAGGGVPAGPERLARDASKPLQASKKSAPRNEQPAPASATPAIRIPKEEPQGAAPKSAQRSGSIADSHEGAGRHRSDDENHHAPENLNWRRTNYAHLVDVSYRSVSLFLPLLLSTMHVSSRFVPASCPQFCIPFWLFSMLMW
jgi:hypothetical protein